MDPPMLRKSSFQRAWPQGRATSGVHWFRQMGQSASTKTIRPHLVFGTRGLFAADGTLDHSCNDLGTDTTPGKSNK
jgi:hypothetical protein